MIARLIPMGGCLDLSADSTSIAFIGPMAVVNSI